MTYVNIMVICLGYSFKHVTAFVLTDETAFLKMTLEKMSIYDLMVAAVCLCAMSDAFNVDRVEMMGMSDSSGECSEIHLFHFIDDFTRNHCNIATIILKH